MTGKGLVSIKVEGITFEAQWENHQYYAILDGEVVERANNSWNLGKKLHRVVAYWKWWNERQLQLW